MMMMMVLCRGRRRRRRQRQDEARKTKKNATQCGEEWKDIFLKQLDVYILRRPVDRNKNDAIVLKPNFDKGNRK